LSKLTYDGVNAMSGNGVFFRLPKLVSHQFLCMPRKKSLRLCETLDRRKREESLSSTLLIFQNWFLLTNFLYIRLANLTWGADQTTQSSFHAPPWERLLGRPNKPTKYEIVAQYSRKKRNDWWYDTRER